MPTAVFIPQDGEPEYPECPFKVGDRVRMKAEFCRPGQDMRYRTGTVATVPDPQRPVLTLGRHTLGRSMGIDADVGGRFVVDDFTKVEPENN